MKRIILLLITSLFLSACSSIQTEAPPTLTPLPPTLIPNPYAEDALITFCESIIEGDVEKALPLFTEDTRVYPFESAYFGLSGVEDLIKEWSILPEYFCEVKNFEVNGDVVEFSWYDRNIETGNDEGLYETKCKCKANMIEEKIDKLDCDCSWETTPIE